MKIKIGYGDDQKVIDIGRDSITLETENAHFTLQPGERSLNIYTVNRMIVIPCASNHVSIFDEKDYL